MVEVTVKYAHPDAQPPIYLAGSFSQVPWSPEEMEFTKQGDEFHFSRKITLESGSHHQYKFRLGSGDWWVLDEEAATATDDLGNRNNVLTAPIPEQHLQFNDTSTDHSTTTIPAVVVEKVDDLPRHGDDFGSAATAGQRDAHEMRSKDAEPDEVRIKPDVSAAVIADTADEVADSAAMIDVPTDRSEAHTADKDQIQNDGVSTSRTSAGTQAASQVADSVVASDDTKSIRTPHPAMSLVHSAETHSGTATPMHEKAPLFAHEVPVFYQEATQDSITDIESRSKFHEKVTEGINGIRQHEDVIHNPGKSEVEKFPGDRQAILQHVNNTQDRLDADETDVDLEPPSPLLGQPLGSDETKSTSTSFQPESLTPPEMTAYKHLHDLEQSTKETFVDLPLNPKDAVAALPPSNAVPAEHTKPHRADTNGGSTNADGHPVHEQSNVDSREQASRDPTEVLVAEGLPKGEGRHHVTMEAFPASDTSPPSSTEGAARDMNHLRPHSMIPAPKDIIPSSFSRPAKEGKPFSIFQVIWRTVFLGWIGGFFSRLRGGDRRA